MFKHKKEKETEIENGILTVSVIDVVEESNDTESIEESNEESNETEIIVDVHLEDVECEDAIDIVEPAEEIVPSEIAIETVVNEQNKKISENFSSNSSKFKSPDIYKCKICDYATKRKGYFNDHKTTSHNWCFICYSSYTSQDDLKKHFKKSHSKALGCLEIKLGKAPR